MWSIDIGPHFWVSARKFCDMANLWASSPLFHTGAFSLFPCKNESLHLDDYTISDWNDYMFFKEWNLNEDKEIEQCQL